MQDGLKSEVMRLALMNEQALYVLEKILELKKAWKIELVLNLS